MKILIVDDEAIFRKGIKHMLQLPGAEWTVVGEAKDGVEAIELAEQLQPDIVITDIRMPRMDGIQLQYILKEKLPYTRCLVMSGYDDFEYVRGSFQLGAQDYLLKPVSKEDLLHAIYKATEIWRTNNRKLREIDFHHLQMKKQLKQHLLHSCITGKLTASELDMFDEVGIHLPMSHFCCMIASLDRHSVFPERYEMINPSYFSTFIYQFILERSQMFDYSYVCYLADGNIAVIHNYNGNEQELEHIRLEARKTMEHLKELCQFTISISFGCQVESIHFIVQSYRTAELTLLSRLHNGGNRLYVYKKSSVLNNECIDSLKWKLFLIALEKSDCHAAQQLIEKIIVNLLHQHSDAINLQHHINRMTFQLFHWISNHDRAEQWMASLDIRNLLAQISSKTEKADLISHLKMIVKELCHHTRTGKSDISFDAIDFVMNYVKTKYNTQITLSMMAEKVFLNPTYLSTLFKQRTGKSFIDYVTTIRIEEAKNKLLYSNEKIVSISTSVGFTHLRHFNRVFKAETGLSPKLFRETFTSIVSQSS